MTGPDAYNLGLIRWDYFATLTFSRELPRPRCFGAYFRFLRLVPATVCPIDRLLWALRAERGERFGRFHFHALLGGLGDLKNPESFRFVLKSWWRQAGGGFADVRRYDQLRAGAVYVTKCLGVAAVARDYELKKFNTADELIVSRGCYRVIAGQKRMMIQRRPSMALGPDGHGLA